MKRKVLRTVADVLEHSYGRKQEEVASPPPPVASPPSSSVPVASPPSEPKPEPSPPSEPRPTTKDLVTQFMNSYSKSGLVELAETADLNTSGTKAEIAARLVKADFIPE
jgi:hypothetical protein